VSVRINRLMRQSELTTMAQAYVSLSNRSVAHNMTTVSALPELIDDYIPTYMLVLCAMLLGAALLGLFGNLVLMAATCWQQKSRHWKYGLHYSIVIANIVLGSMWLPSYMTQIVVNYVGREFPLAMCLVNRMLFHMCFIVVIIGTPFLVVYELCRWSSPSSRSFVDASRKQFVIGGVIAAWSGGLLAATCVIADYSYLSDDQTCRPTLSWRQLTTHSFTSISTSVLSIISGVIVLVLLLSAAVQRQRNTSCSKPKKYCYNNEQCVNGSDAADERDVEGHLLSSQMDREQSDSGVAPPVVLLDASGNKTVDVHEVAANASSDEDDDLFDMKMRLRMQKKSTGGRRHTVANIGLQGSPFGGPRNSLDMGAAKGSNYQYVRKWSVDIQALQNQLENPKIHASSSLISQGSKAPLQNFGLNANTPLQAISAPQRKSERSTLPNKDNEPSKALNVPAITVNSSDDATVAGSGKDDVTVSSIKDKTTVSSGKDNVTISSSKDNVTESSGKDNVTASSGKDNVIVSSSKVTFAAGSGKDTVGQSNDKDNITTSSTCDKDSATTDSNKVNFAEDSGTDGATTGSYKVNFAACSGKDKDKDNDTTGNNKQNVVGSSSKDNVTTSDNKDSATAGTSKDSNIACSSKDNATEGSGKDIPTAGSGGKIRSGKESLIAGNGNHSVTGPSQRPSPGRAKSRRLLLLTLAVNACVFPYVITQTLVGLFGMHVTSGTCHLTAVVCVIQVPLQPLLFVWINRGLRNAVTQLWHQVSQWRCVCYCHLGNAAATHSCCGHSDTKYRHQSVITVSQ